MPTKTTEVGELVSRLRDDLSTVEIDCACRTTLDSALARFSAIERRRRLSTAIEDARRHRDWIAAQLAFLAELDDITDRESDGSVFEEMAVLFDDIVAAARAAAQSIRDASASANEADQMPQRP
ncbi:MAG TPA: hypothetical protein VFY92_01765 [Hyphomicrobiaceae bacterium]|nr:hypothetical protein [Hyphomicrobiaceae bacterium]